LLPTSIAKPHALGQLKADIQDLTLKS
jgi:hypothetical protein